MSRPQKKGRKAGGAPVPSPQEKGAQRPDSPTRPGPLPSLAIPAGGASRSRSWPLLLLFPIQGALLAFIHVVSTAYGPPASISLFDALAQPGSEAVISVRVDRDMPALARRGTRGVELEFLRIGEPLGSRNAAGAPERIASAITGHDGTASATFRAPEKAGSYPIVVRPAAPGRVPFNGEGEALLEVIPAERPLLIVSAPGALAEDGGGAALPGAVDNLRALSLGHSVVYAATRGGEDPERLRVWLKAHDFPPGPVLAGPCPSSPVSVNEFVSARGLSRWPGPNWAVTSRRDEAVSFALSGFHVVLIGGQDVLPVDQRGVSPAPNWKEGRRIVEAQTQGVR